MFTNCTNSFIFIMTLTEYTLPLFCKIQCRYYMYRYEVVDRLLYWVINMLCVCITWTYFLCCLTHNKSIFSTQDVIGLHISGFGTTFTHKQSTKVFLLKLLSFSNAECHCKLTSQLNHRIIEVSDHIASLMRISDIQLSAKLIAGT